MDRLLDEIESYWSTRTEGYSEVNEKELKGMQKKAWLKTLESGFLEKKLSDNDKEQLRILDIGTGPGFFPMILAEAGYHVTAVDYTPGMLEKAAENAAKFIGEKSSNIEFKRMDAQALEFEDESFDVIISRNLTWNLPHPDQAYGEWLRVLKKGGKLMTRSGKPMKTTAGMWKKAALTTIICARILTAWRRSHCRFHCLRQSARDGM